MQDVSHAIDSFRRLAGLPDLDFNDDGIIALMFDGKMPVNISRIDGETIEVWTALTGLGSASDAETLRRLMECNHLGEGTGSARLAVTPDGGDFVLCERIDVRPLNDDQLVDRMVGFVKYTAFWNSGEGSVAAMPRKERAGGDQPSSFVIRA